MANFWQKRAYAELSTEPNALAKRGRVYLLDQFFTVNATSSVAFTLDTSTAQTHFEFYDITTDTGTVQAHLYEGATASVTASVAGHNLNRNYSDNHTIDLHSASAWVIGTQIASELVPSGSKAGGALTQDKTHILRPNTRYLMVFHNTTNQSTVCHLNLGWSEAEPEPTNLWDASGSQQQ